MKKNYIADYCLYYLTKAISIIVRLIPLTLSVYVMRGLGALAFYFLRKKRMIAHRNIKIAFPHYSPHKINRILRQTFMNCAQHFVEIAYMPWIDDRYVNKFIEFEGLDEVLEVMKNNKGGVFLCLHEGSWEVGSAVTARALKDYNYTVLVREQPKAPLITGLLNSYRKKNAPKVALITDSLRPIVESLKKGFAVGMVADHGGQGGILVNFFGRLALTPTGAMKFALKLDTNVVLGFMKRKRGARHKIMLRPYNLIRTGSEENDLRVNLENIHRIYEKYITDSPQEYLWFFKRWKYSPQRSVLVLSDGKAGHLKQSLAVLDLIQKLPLQVKYDVAEVKFSNLLQKAMFYLCGFFFSRKCQGCMRCMLKLFNSKTNDKLLLNYYDAVISCGSSLAMLNRLVAFENMAKSIVIMKPGMFSLKRFDLAIMPEHDRVPKFKNVVSINGAMTRAAERNSEEINKIIKDYGLDKEKLPRPVVGLLLGGSNKYLSLDKDEVKKAIDSLEKFLESSRGSILVSSSRRTAKDIEVFLKDSLGKNTRCKMLIIANEFNPPSAFEAILNLSDILVISGDSISMVSEALDSGKHTIVLKLKKKFPYLLCRHERFVESLRRKEYIYAAHIANLSDILDYVWKRKPAVRKISDKGVILDKLKEIL